MPYSKTIAIATDHAGVALKSYLKEAIEQQGLKVLDLGTEDESSVDYPDFAEKAVSAIKNKHAAKAILICGTGIGMSIAANRHPEIRAALCVSEEMAQLAREHNDANMLALGARFITKEAALKIVQVFLNTEFTHGRHSQRVEKLSKLTGKE